MSSFEILRLFIIPYFVVLAGLVVWSNTKKNEYGTYVCVMNTSAYCAIIMILVGIVYFCFV